MADLVSLTRAEFDLWLDGHQSGYSHGFDAGWRACDAALAALQRAAVRSVHRAASMPVREPLVLELTPEQMARVHADRDRVRGEGFRQGLRAGRSALGVAS